MKPTVFDKNSIQLFDKDTVNYTDSDHKVTSSLGRVRYNGISNIFEVINIDEQSGNNLTRMTLVQKM